MNVPILMITYNRLEYTKNALSALMEHRGKNWIYIIDNGSTDGTKEWLNKQSWRRVQYWFHSKNSIAEAMNTFLHLTTGGEYVAKVDNDTIIPRDFFEKMLPHMEKADIVQAKHKLIEASQVGTFDEWTSKMPADGALRFNHFVGGSGILFKRQLVNHIPETEWKLGGWRQWQREHPEVRKAFATDVEIELLDEHGYVDYPEYYKQTGRV